MLRGIDWDAGAALARKALLWCAPAGAMFLLCRAQVAGGLAPFATALLAAALTAGHGMAALLAGCLAGSVNGTLRDFNLRLPVGAIIVLAGYIGWESLSAMLADGRGSARRSRLMPGMARLRKRPARNRAPSMQARSPNHVEAIACSALAGAGVLIPGMASIGEAVWPEAAGIAAAAVAAVTSAPFFRAALEVRGRRRWLNPEERIGLFLLMGSLLAGLAALSVCAALCVGGAMALLLYPGGALAGVGLGGVLVVMGADLRVLALLASGGATAQLCAALSRPARSTAACGAMLATGLMTGALPPLLASAGASSLLALAVPRAWEEAIAALGRPTPEPCNPQRLAERMQRASVKRLRALGEAFGELSEGYCEPVSAADEQALIRRLRARLCEGCSAYADCWNGGGEGGVKLLCELIARAVALSGEAPLFDEEVPPDLARRCRRARQFPERIQCELEDFARARRERMKRGAENRLIRAQYAQARRLLIALAARQSRPLHPRSRQAARAAAAMERAGIETESVMALGGEDVEIVVALREGRWTEAMARRASTQLARCFGRLYAPTGPLGREARFVRRPRLRADTGICCVSRIAGAPCGDSCRICMLDGNRLLAILSDGMGSGGDAARESAEVVRLLVRFLSAGAPCPLAVETVNALMLNRGGEDMFATVDLLLIDLSSGEARFIKLAACPTLIGRAEHVRRIEGGRLPLGILEKVQPGMIRERLMPGDVLLMASDGVMDAAGDAALEALLADAPRDMPLLARRALGAARSACAQDCRDDMTVLCLRLSERRTPDDILSEY